MSGDGPDLTRAELLEEERRHDESTGADEPTVLPSPRAPLAVARALVRENYTSDGYSLLRTWRGGLWEWEVSKWTEIEERAIRAEAYRFTEHAVFLNDKAKSESWEPNRYKIADLVEALKAVTHLPDQVQPPAWTETTDAPPASELIAVANGLLHVQSRTLHQHDPRFFNEVAVPFPYHEDVPPPARWLAFLDALWPDDPDSIAALQEFFGYVISGRTDLHKILLLVGPTRAGKGVIGRVLKALVGNGHHAGPTLASLATNFGLAPLIGKPLAIISDARLGGANVYQVVERLLSISGEDMLTIDRKYREPWTGTLPTRFLVISNELPRFGDASGAIAGRFSILSLRRSWLGQENPELTRELYVELPGILGWALDGLCRLQAQDGRFTEPKSSVDAVVALQDLVSPVAAFVRDRCNTAGQAPDLEVPCDDLYAAWKSWADDNGHRAGSSATFGRDLRAVVPALAVVRPREGDSRRRRYQGIALAPRDNNGRSAGPLGPDQERPLPGPGGPRDRRLLSQERENADDPPSWVRAVV